MAHPQYNQYQQNMHGMPPLQTQTHPHSPQNAMPHQQRAFSPPAYQQSPGAMSPPTSGGVPPAKRQRLSPQPMSPYNSHYNSPFSNSNPPYTTSPYATSPPAAQYLSLPHSPASAQPPTPSFHQPQPYQHPNMAEARLPPQGSMPPPKVPYSKTQDTTELEKANAKDMDPNNLADVLTGVIDVRAEEEALLAVDKRNYNNSFNSQGSPSTGSPHGSFNQWNQQANHGAFQGTGPLTHAITEEQQHAELLRKHERAARIHNETASQPLTDPFLLAAGIRARMAKKAFEHGIKLDLEGLFDKIPEATPQNVTRHSLEGSNGETIVGLQATSLLNNNAPLVDLLSLLSVAAEERVRTVLEDSFVLSQGRQNTSHGVVPPSLADLAVASGEAQPTEAVVPNISKTAWEAPDSAVSPMTVTAQKQPPNAARLPTPPSDAPPTPQPTVQFATNHVANTLKRRVLEDQRFEEARIAKRQKRLQGNSGTPADTPIITPLPLPEKMTKKERDRIHKMGQTEDVLHRKANETASMALGKKKKYSWMTGGGGGGGGSGATTPRVNTALAGGASGTATPTQQQTNRELIAKKRQFQGGDLEKTSQGARIQIRDLVHVLELDGKERKTLVQILARIRSEDKDEKKIEDRPRAVPAAR